MRSARTGNRIRIPALAIAAAMIAAALPAADAGSLLARGDAAWSERDRGHEGASARPEPIAAAISAFTEGLEAEPDNLEVRWKLLRALYFKGEYVLDDPDEKLVLFEHGRAVADTGRSQLERQYKLPEDSMNMKPGEVADLLSEDPDAAEIYFWSAAHWGLWGRHRGKIAAARQGVAKKIRHFSEIVILLDEEMEEAGGHRILGRLHTEAPKLPFVTGWVSRDRAVSELRRALELAPEGLLTHLYLAEALLEFRPEKRQEALDILEALVERTPDPDHVVEQTKVIEDAKLVLEKQHS